MQSSDECEVETLHFAREPESAEDSKARDCARQQYRLSFLCFHETRLSLQEVSGRGSQSVRYCSDCGALGRIDYAKGTGEDQMWVWLSPKLKFFLHAPSAQAQADGEMMTEQQIKSWFAYSAPTADQISAMQQFRDIAGELATQFCAHSNAGPDQTLALRKLKETLMAMNAALVSPTPRTY